METDALSADLENKKVYEGFDTVEHYVHAEGLQPAEKILFARHIPANASVLDIGIGGGRTTAALKGKVRSYVGIDYSGKMVEGAKRRLPGLDLRVMDAADLSDFPNEFFDTVIFSFNGLDYLHPEEKRHKCLRECARVLKPGGRFIYSTHNPRWLLSLPDFTGIGPLRAVRRLAFHIARSAKLLLTQPLQAPFWEGRGYFVDPVHGGLVTYSATVKKVENELNSTGLELVEHKGGAADPAAHSVFHPWNYFAAQRRP